MSHQARLNQGWIVFGFICAALCGGIALFLLGGDSHQGPAHGGAFGTHQSSDEALDAESAGAESGTTQRTGTNKEFRIHLPDLERVTPVGTIHLVQRTNRLDQRISLGTFVGDMLLKGAVLKSLQISGPEVQFSIPIPQEKDEFAALVEVQGFSPVAKSLTNGITTIPLVEVEPVTIIVSDSDKVPVQGAGCWFMTAGHEQIPSSWTGALEQFGFQSYGVTDEEGRAVFLSARPVADNQVQVIPPGNLSTQGVTGIRPGQAVRIVCEPGFSVLGRVSSLATGEPLPGASVLAVGRDHNQHQALGTAIADDFGVFRFEGLPIDFPSLFLEGEADGFAFARVEILTPKANETREYHIELASAVSSTFRVQTPWGEPIRNCSLTIREERKGLTHEDIESDSDGIVHVSNRLRVDRDYHVIFNIGDWVALGAGVLTPGVTENMTVSRVARVQRLLLDGLPEDFNPTKITWYASSSVRPGKQSWPVDGPSPLVPSGPGYWVVESDLNHKLGIEGSLPQGITESVQLDFKIAEVKYELPEGGPYTVRLTSLTGDSLFEREGVESGQHSFSASAGVYCLQVWAENMDREWTGIEIPPGGRDLGLIEGFEYCGMGGRVLDEEGRGLPGVTVSAYGQVPFGFRHGFTDAEGDFEFHGMAPGEYMLVVAGEDAYGTLIVEQSLPVFLRPGQWLGPMEIEAAIPSSNSHLTLSWDGSSEEGAMAWVVGKGVSMVRSFAPNGLASFSSPSVDGLALGVAFSPGLLVVQDGRLSPVDSDVGLTRGQHTNVVRFVDEMGQARNDIRFSLSSSGMPFNFFGCTNEVGTLRVTASAGLPIEIKVRELSGMVRVYSLDDFLQTSEIKIPRERENHRIRMTDSHGMPLRAAVALKFGSGEFHHADGYGVMELPFDTEEAFFVEAPGYLGRWLKEPTLGPVALPRILFDVSFAPSTGLIEGLPQAISGVRVTPLELDEEMAFQEFFDFSWDEGGTVFLPPFPEGKTQVLLLGEDGEELWEMVYLLTDHDQILD